jgi:hypothetical protein
VQYTINDAATGLVIYANQHFLSCRLQQMRRNGILKAIVEKYLPFDVADDNLKPPKSVGLQKMMPIFIVYVTGVFVSILCLLTELRVHRRYLPRAVSFIN